MRLILVFFCGLSYDVIASSSRGRDSTRVSHPLLRKIMIEELSKAEIQRVAGAEGEASVIGSGLGWVAGKVAGAEAGAAIGAGIGSVVPGIGTVGGSIIGAGAGAMYGPGLGMALGGYIGLNLHNIPPGMWKALTGTNGP
jgi:hypothetical protein